LFDGGKFIDEVVVTAFKSPNSILAEDVAEISSHGGSFIYRRISDLLVKRGCDHAEPGEFSKRAFLNVR
jgi:tRNA modification GTPase